MPPPHRRWFAISEDAKNWRQPIEQHYDPANATTARLPFKNNCDRLIHHFAFESRYDAAADKVEILEQFFLSRH